MLPKEVKVKEKDKKAFRKRLPAKERVGQGKGARLRYDVSAAVLLGCLHRTQQRIRYEPELADYHEVLVGVLRCLGGL